MLLSSLFVYNTVLQFYLAKTICMKRLYTLTVLLLTSAAAYTQNVGIGTTNPERPLHLRGMGEVLRLQGNQPWIGILNDAETDYSGFLYYPDTSIVLGTRAGINKQVVLAPNNIGLLWANPLNGGRTGIGISLPQNKLHVLSATSGDGLRITAPQPAVRLYEDADEKGYFKVAGTAVEVGSGSLPVTIKTGSTNVLTAGTNGTIGIGTTPLTNTRLHINGAADNDVLRITGSDKPGISWYVNTDKAGSFEIGSIASSRFFDFKAEAFAPVFRFTDAATGNVGVTVAPATANVIIGNNTTPGSLEVNGYTRLGSFTDGAPAIKMKVVSGNMPAANSTLQYNHGLALDQILGVTVLSTGAFGNRKVAPGNTFAGNEYTYLVFAGNIEITTTAANSGNVINRPVSICITYTE